MRYFVVDLQGAQYGPADLAILNQWAAQGRILPETILVEESTGRQMQAQAVMGLQFLPMPGQPQAPTYGAPLPPGGPFSQAPQMGQGGPFSSVADGSKDLNMSYAMSAGTLVLCTCVPGLPVLTGIAAIMYARSAGAKGHPSASSAMLMAILATGLAAVVTFAVGSVLRGMF